MKKYNKNFIEFRKKRGGTHLLIDDATMIGIGDEISDGLIDGNFIVRPDFFIDRFNDQSGVDIAFYFRLEDDQSTDISALHDLVKHTQIGISFDDGTIEDLIGLIVVEFNIR